MGRRDREDRPSGEQGEDSKDLPAERPQEVEPLMGIAEFGETNKVNKVLLAGFITYCREQKLPPRLTQSQWKDALNNWRNAPVTA